jgi:large subunit ribosomal protein L9
MMLLVDVRLRLTQRYPTSPLLRQPLSLAKLPRQSRSFLSRNMSRDSMILLKILILSVGLGRMVSEVKASFVRPCKPRYRYSSSLDDPCFSPNSHGSKHSQERLVQRKFSVTTFSKRKGASGGASPSSATKKVQVKLLKYVAGIGQKGEIVRVSPSVLNNLLRPSQAALVITDEEVQKELFDTAAHEREVDRSASLLKNEIEEMTLSIVRKAGPDGKLFGGIGPKVIIDELKSKLGSSATLLDRKGVKILSIVDADGVKVQGDVKRVGPFGATIALTKDVSAKLQAEVRSEN